MVLTPPTLSAHDVGLAAMAAALAPVALYMCGPQPDDLAPIVTLSSHGFAPDARAIVFNEGVA